MRPDARRRSPPSVVVPVAFACDRVEGEGQSGIDSGFACAEGGGADAGHVAMYFMQMSHEMQVDMKCAVEDGGGQGDRCWFASLVVIILLGVSLSLSLLPPPPPPPPPPLPSLSSHLTLCSGPSVEGRNPPAKFAQEMQVSTCHANRDILHVTCDV